MEPAVPSGSIQPLNEDTDILTVVDEAFENLYDVPFVTVNRIDGEIQAEVYLTGVKEIDEDRLEAAFSVAREHGHTAYSRVFGDDDNVTIHFSEDPAKGLIWGLFEGDTAWSQ